MNEVGEVDRALLSAIFASRVSSAKRTEDEEAEQARVEHKKIIAWVKSDSVKPRSFRWFCETFDMEPSAVRRAIAEKSK